jgi:ClpP class serine protease
VLFDQTDQIDQIDQGYNKMTNSIFQRALEIVESLPAEQREDLIELVRRRLIDERRECLAQTIAEAREEYKRGEVKRGTVDDLLRELSE